MTKGLLTCLALLFLVAAPRPVFACAGDCDWSGQVEVTDLVRLVNVALGRQEVTSCIAGDRDGVAGIKVNEVVTAVNRALTGCAPVPADGLTAATLAAARAIAYITRVTPAVGIAYDGVDGSTPCELGGALSGACEDVAPGALRATVSTTDCRDYTYESTMAYNGTATVRALGGCLLAVLPYDIRVGFAMNVINQSEEGAALLDTRLDADVALQEFLFGPSPCSIKGAIATLDGTLAHRTADGREVVADYAMRTRTDFADFLEHPSYGCEALTVNLAVDGRVRLRDSYGSGQLETLVEASGLRTHIDRSAREVTLSGSLMGDCFDGAAEIETLEPLTFLLGESCYSAGKLRITTPAGATLVTINADTSIDIDAGDDGSVETHYDSCAELPASCEQEGG